MKISIGSDHGGFNLKEFLISKLESENIEFINVGTKNNIDSVDYTDYAVKVTAEIKKGHADFGIVICGSGIGMSIAANKVNGIRAALCTNEYEAEMTRKHNNANVLSLGARVIGEELALNICKKFLAIEYEGGRHQRRLDKITEIEKNN